MSDHSHYFHLPPLQVSCPTSTSTREEVLYSRAAAIQQQWEEHTHVPSLAKLTLAASLAKQGNLKCPKPSLQGILIIIQGYLSSVAHLNLTNVDISCIPGSDLAALASITGHPQHGGSVTLSRVRGGVGAVLGSIACQALHLDNMALSTTATRSLLKERLRVSFIIGHKFPSAHVIVVMMRVHLALVQCLHERVQLLELGAGVSLALDTLLSYSGGASCRWISLRGDTAARCGPGVTQWAQRVGWEVDLGRGWLAAHPACDCDIGIGSWADVWLN